MANLGVAYTALGNYQYAISLCEQALALYDEIGDRQAKGTMLGNLGNAHHLQGDLQSAAMYYHRHLEIASSVGDKLGEGNALWNISLVLNGLGERAKAIVHAEKAFKIYKKVESPNTAKVHERLVTWYAQD